MDIISHALVGRIIAELRKDYKQPVMLITMFAVLPDIFLMPLYLFIGYTNSRPFWIPHHSDWDGFRSMHPMLSSAWEIPHSIFFALLVVLPLLAYFRLPLLAFVSYMSHLFVDVLTHNGEWGMKIFYPLNYAIDGFTNMWSWSLSGWVISWIILMALFALLSFALKRWYGWGYLAKNGEKKPAESPDEE